MYAELDIGTAKPTPDERAQVPHHLFDCVAPTQQVTAGEYARQARQILAEFPDSAYQRALQAVTDLVTDRDH